MESTQLATYQANWCNRHSAVISATAHKKLLPLVYKVLTIDIFHAGSIFRLQVANGIIKREKSDGENCPLCTIGHKNITNYEMDIIDPNDEIKVLEIGKRLMEQLCHAARDYSDITQHDIIIKRFGTGIDTQYLISIGDKNGIFYWL